MLKKAFIHMFSPLFAAYAFLRYKDIWGIKAALQNKKENPMLKYIYFNYLSKKGSWIGYTSEFKGIPLFPHGVYGIYISNAAEIGKGCVIFHQVTIGSNTLSDSKGQGSPIIGDNVYIGAGAKIIGGIKIGSNCRIGANAVVYTDMPDNTVAVCSPTRLITKTKTMDNRHYMYTDSGKRCWYDFDLKMWIHDEK
jgi:serine O-acetyltransferase